MGNLKQFSVLEAANIDGAGWSHRVRSAVSPTTGTGTLANGGVVPISNRALALQILPDVDVYYSWGLSATTGLSAANDMYAYALSPVYLTIPRALEAENGVEPSALRIDGVSTSAVITTQYAHGLAVNDVVEIVGVAGATEVNGFFQVATTPSATTFTVKSYAGVAVSSATAFTGVGYVSKPTLFLYLQAKSGASSGVRIIEL